MTLKALSKPRRGKVLEPTHRTARPHSQFRGQTQHPVQQPLFLLDRPQPLVPRVLVQRQHLANNKELLPLGQPLLVPPPSASLLLLVSLPLPSLLSVAQPRVVGGFLLLLDQDRQHSQLLRPIQLLLPDQFSGSLRLAVPVAEPNQEDNQYLAPPTLLRQIRPSRGPAPSAQRQGPDLGKRLLSVSLITHPPPLGTLRRLQLQHSPKHLWQPLLRRRHRHLGSLHQTPRRSVNRRRYLVSLPPLPLSIKILQPLLLVNQTLPLVRQHQPNSLPLAKLCRQYHRAVPRVDPNLMRNLLLPISQMRSRRTDQAWTPTTLYYQQTIPRCCRIMCARPSQPHNSLGITSLIGSHPWICDRSSYLHRPRE
jgi:hypothetical protein